MAMIKASLPLLIWLNENVQSLLSLLPKGHGDKGHGDRYVGSLFRVDEPVPDDSDDSR